MKHTARLVFNRIFALKSKFLTSNFKRILVDAALNTETFKNSLHYVTFRVLISISSTVIMMFSCFYLPKTDLYLKFFLEIVACLYVQKMFVVLHPHLLSLQKKTTFVTDILIINSKKAMFLFSCELCLYFFVYVGCFVVNISSSKIQYMIAQQVFICAYNNFSIIYEKYIYFLEYSNFEVIEYPKTVIPVYEQSKDRILIETKNKGTNSLTVVHNYF